MSMTIIQAKKLQRETERKIMGLINEFQSKTGLQINSVSCSVIESIQGKAQNLTLSISL